MWRFALTCLKCGGPVEPRATGPVQAAGRMVRAVADCRTCRVQHLVTVALDTIPKLP